MQQNTVIGVDLAKASFQIHKATMVGRMIKSVKLSRQKFSEFLAKEERTTIFMEACGSSNFWARKAKRYGHEVKLIAPQYVTPYRKRHKTDAADAAAIVEAGTREHMNFVPIKTIGQQDMQSLRRIRQLEVETRTALMNQIRGLLAEYGIAIPKGHAALREALIECCTEGKGEESVHDLSPQMRQLLIGLQSRLRGIDERVTEFDKELERAAQADERCKRIMTIPGVGPVTATAIISQVGDAREFKSARQLAAWMGLTPKQHSTGGKVTTLGISKAGNKDLRTLLIHGGRAVMMNPGKKKDKRSEWAVSLKERVGMNKAAVAMAHKNVRTIYALLRNGTEFKDNYKPRLPICKVA
ncbi:MAG: IS110 family transposase [Oligoflexales bacterium]|nr:IS110 family transposase [Oligoflexales bacterium]